MIMTQQQFIEEFVESVVPEMLRDRSVTADQIARAAVDTYKQFRHLRHSPPRLFAAVHAAALKYQRWITARAAMAQRLQGSQA